jgi:pimeloyl-ACP methyl ester carboxylesterase
MPHHLDTGLYFESHGSGEGIFFGPPLMASVAAEPEIQQLKDALIQQLGSRYRLLFVDYPYGRGQSAAPAGSALSVDKAMQDLTRIADAAGLDRFIWFGYSWGAILGFQLALRTNRLAALIAGGFAPVDGPYALIRDTCRHLALHPPPGHTADFMGQYREFYDSLVYFNDRECVSRMQIPRLIYAGTHDVVGYEGGQANIADIIQANRQFLEDLGWQVCLVPDADHPAAVEAPVVIPLLRSFLARLGQNGGST